jgi:hypothetical protein
MNVDSPGRADRDGASSPGDGAVLVSTACRPLRRELRPVAWAVLEDVAMDAVVEDGRLIARTSARRLAQELGIDPGTAAGALRLLRQRQLLFLERGSGPAGRFGLSIYVLARVTGMTVPDWGGEGPAMAPPHEDPPLAAGPHMAAPHLEEPGPELSDTTTHRQASSGRPASPATADAARRRRRTTATTAQAPGQATFGFELGSA